VIYIRTNAVGRFMVDGASVATTAGGNTGDGGDLWLGAAHWSDSFRGRIDETRISAMGRSTSRVWAEFMNMASNGSANPDGSIIYHSGMNPKIQRNFEVFAPCDFIAAITQHIPSPKWRERIKKVWVADPLLCPRCQKEMRIVSLIDERTVIERILPHLGLWTQGVRVDSGPDPPSDWVIEPCFDDTFPACRGVAQRRRDYDTELDLACAND
jgi:hypothetical protein